jgi:hypothetical protein
MNTTKKYNINT